MDIQNKGTAVPNERQFKTTKEIIKDIIKIFTDNVLPISEANYILEETSKRLSNQPVIIISEDIQQIYKMRNRGILKN